MRQDKFQKPLNKVLIFLCFAIFLSFASASSAQINACNTDVTGKTLKWNAKWAKDNKDNNVAYKIIRVTELEKGKILMFELSGPNTSNKSQRDFLIKDKTIMKEFCDNIDLSIGGITNDSIHNDQDEELSQTQLIKLPYIKYTKNGWQRTSTPANTNLSSCNLLGKQFSCTMEDKKLYADKLMDLEEEIKLMEELGY